MYDGMPALTIDRLVESNGNYMVVYLNGNWGLDHIMMILFDTDPSPASQETLINNSCMCVINGTYEEAQAVPQWLEKHSDLPFIVKGTSFLDCAQKMDDLVRAYGDDWDRFHRDCEIYDNWRAVVHYVDNGPPEIMYHVWGNGWESLIDDAKRWIHKEYH